MKSVTILRGRRCRYFHAASAALLFAVVGVGCARPARVDAAPAAEALPLALGRDELSASLLDGMKKRLRGRLESRRGVERIVRDVAPVVRRAARQPQAEAAFRRMAREQGVTPDAARARWVALQEADLLLESGGDPDALSVAKAAGVAQWLAGTARGAGLRVEQLASDRLTVRIDELARRIAWIEYLRHPRADRRLPGAPRLDAPGALQAAVAKLPRLRAERDALRRRRRQIDHRYDPERAIFAQTRYLLRLYPRFPRADWLFQAYHGGEAGVTRTLRLYLGGAWPGSAAQAIRRGNRGRPLSFEDVYFTTTPAARPAAFSYLYGRSDDHRYYWWKLRAAAESIALFRHDPARWTREWEAFLPGRPVEALWHRYEEHAALRPEARGALVLIQAAYRQAGGGGDLALADAALGAGDMARREARLASARARLNRTAKPPDPLTLGPLPGGGPPFDVDYHATGWVFDVVRPAGADRRKRLEYALGYLRDRGILYWSAPRDYEGRAYHVVPAPRHAASLARLATRSVRPPALPGL